MQIPQLCDTSFIWFSVERGGAGARTRSHAWLLLLPLPITVLGSVAYEKVGYRYASRYLYNRLSSPAPAWYVRLSGLIAVKYDARGEVFVCW